MAELTVTTQTLTASTAVAKLAGEMGPHGLDALEDAFSLMLESGVKGLVLDLSGLDSVSSAGVGAFLDMASVLAGKKGKLVLAALKPKILGTLEMLRVHETLVIANNVEAARKLFAGL